MDSDAFTTVKAAGWERQAAGYGRLISRITARVPLPPTAASVVVATAQRFQN